MSYSYSIFAQWAQRLTAAGVPAPDREVRRIVRHVLNLRDEGQQLPYGFFEDTASIDRIALLVEERAKRIPFERILGLVEFEGVEIEVGANVYRPSPETGVVVEHALVELEKRNGALRILDVGSGTGCMLLALLKALPAASGVGIDPNASATELSIKNASRNSLSDRSTFRQEKWTSKSDEKYDLVIANAPRVATADIPRLVPEMRDHDPWDAFDGGEDGLSFFRELVRGLSAHLKDGGLGIFQVGPRLAPKVRSLFLRAGFPTQIKFDFAGRPSCVLVINSPRKKTLLDLIRRAFDRAQPSP